MNYPCHSLENLILKTCQSKIVYKYMHSTLTGVQVLVTGSFLLGLLTLTTGKEITIEMSYSDVRSLGIFSEI
jgi:hypothetical protein